MTIYCFDLDGTLCTNTDGDYTNAKPYGDSILAVNKLYDAGNIIHIQTARGFTTGIDWRDTTEEQLEEWGLKYHNLHFSKVTADVYVDDKGINAYVWHNSHTDPIKILKG